jgi:hypothetical protein
MILLLKCSNSIMAEIRDWSKHPTRIQWNLEFKSLKEKIVDFVVVRVGHDKNNLIPLTTSSFTRRAFLTSRIQLRLTKIKVKIKWLFYSPLLRPHILLFTVIRSTSSFPKGPLLFMLDRNNVRLEWYKVLRYFFFSNVVFFFIWRV